MLRGGRVTASLASRRVSADAVAAAVEAAQRLGDAPSAAPLLSRFRAAEARGFRPPTPTPPPPTAAQVAAAAAAAERAAQDAEYAASLAMDEAREASEAEAALAEVERCAAEEAAAAVAEAEAAAAVAAEEERREERRRRAAALPPPPAAGGASIVVRMADGRRVNRRFAPESPLRHVIEWVEGEAPAVGAYSLATSYPARVLGAQDHGATLESLGLGGGGTLFLQEEDDDEGQDQRCRASPFTLGSR